jgi:hypothetical protein
MILRKHLRGKIAGIAIMVGALVLIVGAFTHLLIDAIIMLITIAGLSLGMAIPVMWLARKIRYKNAINDVRNSMKAQARSVRENRVEVSAESPLAAMREALTDHDPYAISVMDSYRNLEREAMDAHASLEPIREKYRVKFDGLDRLLSFRKDLIRDPKLYGIDLKTANTMIAESTRSIELSILDDTRSFTDRKVMEARATADYINSDAPSPSI